MLDFLSVVETGADQIKVLEGLEGPSNAPSLFTALPEQLGLKLEAAQASVRTLVIDRLERPTEN